MIVSAGESIGFGGHFSGAEDDVEVKGCDEAVPPEVLAIKFSFCLPIFEVPMIGIYFDGGVCVLQEHPPVFQSGDDGKEFLVVCVVITLGSVVTLRHECDWV